MILVPLTSRHGIAGVALITLVRQLGGDIAQTADDRLADEAQQTIASSATPAG
jgi:hypothetical protein